MRLPMIHGTTMRDGGAFSDQITVQRRGARFQSATIRGWPVPLDEPLLAESLEGLECIDPPDQEPTTKRGALKGHLTTIFFLFQRVWF